MSQLTQPLHQRMNRRKGIMIVLTRRIGPTFPQVCMKATLSQSGNFIDVVEVQIQTNEIGYQTIAL